MRLKNLAIVAAFSFALLFFFEFSITSCARRGSPSGGPKDTIAPVLDTSFPPNRTIHFRQKEVTMVFNEYIALKSPSQQISFSPPLKNKPEISTRGKELLISWKKDTLLDNTTYIISFGNSVTDFTEGNINHKLKYVFSTGDFIDSLTLEGKVVDALNGTGMGQMMIALYDLKTLKHPDSIPYFNLPTYYTFTETDGSFRLENLKYSNFVLVAFEDSRANFKMNTGAEKTAFLGDTLKTSLNHKPITLYAFTPPSPDRFYGARQVARGEIQLAFNYPIKHLVVEPLDTSLSKAFHFLSFTDAKDTAFYWFKQTERDSLVLLITQPGRANDTAIVSLRDLKAPSFKLNVVSEEVKMDEPVQFRGNNPVKMAYDSLILAYTSTDTIAVSTMADSANPLLLNVLPKKRLKEYKIFLKKGAVESIFGEKSDSVLSSIKSLRKEDLGNLDFTVKTDSTYPLVLQIFSPDHQKIVDREFRASTTVQLRNQIPGEYTVKLIIDKNGDGKWTTGDYLKGRQAEKIILYKEKAEIRANWDLELEWQPEIQSKISNESRSDKN